MQFNLWVSGPPPVLHCGGSQQYEVLLDEVVGLGQVFVSVSQRQFGLAQQVENLFVLGGAQRPVSNTQRPQTFL